MITNEIGRQIERDRVLDILRNLDGCTAPIISSIARMPLVTVFQTLMDLERDQRAFRAGDKWYNT